MRRDVRACGGRAVTGCSGGAPGSGRRRSSRYPPRHRRLQSRQPIGRVGAGDGQQVGALRRRGGVAQRIADADVALRLNDVPAMHEEQLGAVVAGEDLGDQFLDQIQEPSGARRHACEMRFRSRWLRSASELTIRLAERTSASSSARSAVKRSFTLRVRVAPACVSGSRRPPCGATTSTALVPCRQRHHVGIPPLGIRTHVVSARAGSRPVARRPANGYDRSRR